MVKKKKRKRKKAPSYVVRSHNSAHFDHNLVMVAKHQIFF